MESPVWASGPQWRHHCPLPSNGYQPTKVPDPLVSQSKGPSKEAIPSETRYRKRKVTVEILGVLDSQEHGGRCQFHHWEVARRTLGRDNWDGEGNHSGWRMETYVGMKRHFLSFLGKLSSEPFCGLPDCSKKAYTTWRLWKIWDEALRYWAWYCRDVRLKTK